MPVRIYDLAKKLGIESKEVIAKAKELGIAGARVPSSSLDKITAEYLESHFTPVKPVAAPTPPSPPQIPEPIVLVTAPPEPKAEPTVAETPTGESETVSTEAPVPPPVPEP